MTIQSSRQASAIPSKHKTSEPGSKPVAEQDHTHEINLLLCSCRMDIAIGSIPGAIETTSFRPTSKEQRAYTSTCPLLP